MDSLAPPLLPLNDSYTVSIKEKESDLFHSCIILEMIAMFLQLPWP